MASTVGKDPLAVLTWKVDRAFGLRTELADLPDGIGGNYCGQVGFFSINTRKHVGGERVEALWGVRLARLRDRTVGIVHQLWRAATLCRMATTPQHWSLNVGLLSMLPGFDVRFGRPAFESFALEMLPGSDPDPGSPWPEPMPTPRVLAAGGKTDLHAPRD